ncbi:hypothetical protein ALC62_14859 [Cyphomyrmex costatus]|uniref:Uncharacterized protein n=1 Tax=Cyphomyrmex costatus TaxID=456900 RepID=A0A195C2H6_9HYME|nr:hypothetical protein ALC62_14859 [Cyphomyrmex costatus]
MNRTIYRGKFSESSVGVPIAAVAGSNSQSSLPLVRQVGASRDLSEATRRGAVRALWGTVTHRRLWIAQYFLRITQRVPINLQHLELWIISWINDRSIRVSLLHLTGSFRSSNYILPLSVLLKIIIVDMAAGGLDPTGLY